jgi:phytoene desaturase
MNKHAIIIGAGMGGMAASLRLRKLGFSVTLLEKESRLGGRSNVIEEAGFRVDTGPTILVMKEAFEATYRDLGYDIHRRIQFEQLDPNYRVYYHDGSYLDLHSNMAQLAQAVEEIEPGSAERLFRFLGDSALKYELALEFVQQNYDRVTDMINPRALLRLFRTQAHQNLYRQVSRYFNGNDKLTKAFAFHSMFLGLSPFEAQAMYSLITYADLALGMWYPHGGIYAIIEDMQALALDLGVEIRTQAPVSQILIESRKVSGVRLENGEVIQADLVVSNADLPYTYQSLVPAAYQGKYRKARLERMNYACSGYLLYLGVNRIYPNVRHQGLYFSEDFRANLDAIFKSKILPEQPSFHLNIPTVSDPSLAPEGHSLIYLLAPMPNTSGSIEWDQAAPSVRNHLIGKLEELIDPQIRDHIVWEREFRPTDFTEQFNAVHGTAFGSLSHNFFQSTFFRPHNKARSVDGLYFVGQGTYPGIGMPMVHLSAKLVAERIEAEWM